MVLSNDQYIVFGLKIPFNKKDDIESGPILPNSNYAHDIYDYITYFEKKELDEFSVNPDSVVNAELRFVEFLNKKRKHYIIGVVLGKSDKKLPFKSLDENLDEKVYSAIQKNSEIILDRINQSSGFDFKLGALKLYDVSNFDK